MEITKVYFLKVPLEIDYKHTLYFESKQAQTDYFLSKVSNPGLKYDDFSYQRKDNLIRVNRHFDVLYDRTNYVMYQNSNSSKWYYAFITDMKYINDNRTDVYIETDVMQTWLFDYDLKSCFVEREHTDYDNIGANTLPEGLETGDYICDKSIDYQPLLKRGYVIGATVNLKQAVPTDDNTGLKFPAQYGTLYNGVYSGVKYRYYTTYGAVQDKLLEVDKTGQAEAINSVFMVPANFIGVADSQSNIVYGTLDGDISASTGATEKRWNSSTDDSGNAQTKVTMPDNINGYVPKNKKLLTYPYCYISMDNNCGASAIYHFEHFDAAPNFVIYFAITPGCSIRLLPLNYKNKSENIEEGLTGGKLPICSWATDVYTNWLTQNSLNIANQMESAYIQPLMSLGASAMGGSMGNTFITGVNSAYSGYAQIRDIMATKYQHSLQPPQAKGNVNSGDVTFANRKLTFTANVMTIKKEYAKCIDAYFSMYGYLTNRVKLPNKNHRAIYWYTKTIGCDLAGDVPQTDLQKIKNCYDKGITFWNKDAEVGVYCDQNNNLLDNATI